VPEQPPVTYLSAPATVNASVNAAISSSLVALLDLAELPSGPRPGRRKQGLAVKYIPVRYARTYQAMNNGLYIGVADYTWGRGVYVTAVQEPLSTAIFGRVGVVGRFDPYRWRVFDARDPGNIALYTEWLRLQANFDDALLTVHSDYWFHFLRNTFREQFSIDCVLFHPDELDQRQRYTRQTDTWLAISDWDGPRLRSGYSDQVKDVRLVIIGEEEFVPDNPAFTRTAQLEIDGTSPNHPAVTRRVVRAYRNRSVVRLKS